MTDIKHKTERKQEGHMQEQLAETEKNRKYAHTELLDTPSHNVGP